MAFEQIHRERSTVEMGISQGWKMKNITSKKHKTP
jgi:hypothetical protein